ncbi:hypothetical protein BH23ACI1_BH23ACI1_03040 [soil metagenome]
MIACPNCGTSYPPNVRLCPKDGTVLEGHRPTEERFVGAVLQGKYRLESHLSSGGMGAVFRATHVMLNKPVAVKLIKAELVSSDDVVRRFQREARAATSLNHPGIVAVYDLGQTDDGTLYIAMELVDGRSLKDEIRRQGRIDPPRIVSIVRQVASALALAHRHHIIHRDLKPQNVMLTRDSEGREITKLLDFGIAKTFDEVQTELTAPGYALGTPQYMSPEQTMGKDVDGRSDLYSLGVMLYEMLVGEVPFTDPSTPAILVKHMTETPAPPSRRRPDIGIPPFLEAVALKCLEKDPANRYQTAEELAAALEAGAGREPARPLGASPSLAVGALRGALDDPDLTMPTPQAGMEQALAAPDVGLRGTRPTVPAPPVTPEAGFTPKPGSSLGALGSIAAIIALIAGLGGALWFFTERAGGGTPQATTDTGSHPPDASLATALPPIDRAEGASTSAAGPPADQVIAPGETAAASASASGAPGGGGSATTPPQRAPGGSAASSGTGNAGAAAPSTQAAPRPASGVPPATTGSPLTGAAPPPVGAASPPAPSTQGVQALPASPSVFVECRGAGEVCGAVRAAFDQALERERLGIARSSDRADIILVATATAIDERREQQFGTVMAVRTYSIEVMGDAPKLDRVIPMAPARTFSFDQRLGAERANENARVVAIDTLARVKAFMVKGGG